mgnify:CR=1 FL=1
MLKLYQGFNFKIRKQGIHQFLSAHKGVFRVKAQLNVLNALMGITFHRKRLVVLAVKRPVVLAKKTRPFVVLVSLVSFLSNKTLNVQLVQIRNVRFAQRLKKTRKVAQNVN